MKAIQEHIEIEYLKSLTYTKINDILHELNDKINNLEKLKSSESMPLGDLIQNEFINGIRNTKANGEARRFIMGYCKKLNK